MTSSGEAESALPCHVVASLGTPLRRPRQVRQSTAILSLRRGSWKGRRAFCGWLDVGRIGRATKLSLMRPPRTLLARYLALDPIDRGSKRHGLSLKSLYEHVPFALSSVN